MDWVIIVVVIAVLVVGYMGYAWFMGKWPFGPIPPSG